MRLFYLGLLVGVLIIFALESLAFEFDEDTVEITASGEQDDELPSQISRGKRSTDDEGSAVSRAKISINCKTARNEEGICKPFKECYPLFLLRDLGTEGNLITANFELEGIYRNVSGPCDKDVLDAISSINIGKGVSMSMDEYVCCPNDKKKPVNQPSRPPAPPAPRPEVSGDNKCGKMFVTYRNEVDQADLSVADDNATLRIVNGRQASKGEFPWAVALMNRGAQFCGGSLISNSHILTAAHCVYYMNQKDVSKMEINIGDHNVYSTVDGPHEIRSASNIYYHRGFSMSTLYDDVAVIRLSKPVTFGKYIQPVCLHTGNPRYDTGSVGADVVGWGQIKEKGPLSFVLNTVQVRVMTNTECAKAYGKKAPAGISSGMTCAGGSGRDSCKGDSGGPLTIDSHSQAKQIGIVSWGIGCATYPGVYSRVDKYLPWIYKNQR